MKIKKLVYVLSLFALIANTPLFAKESPQAVVPAPVYIFSEDKQSFAIPAGHAEFVLKVKSNPTTGYMWYLREYDRSLITPIKHTMEKPSGKLLGVPGFELWTFRVKPEGFVVPQQTTIRLIYARPWQSDSSTQLVFRVSTQP